jgi:hypothetical protein
MTLSLLCDVDVDQQSGTSHPAAGGIGKHPPTADECWKAEMQSPELHNANLGRAELIALKPLLLLEASVLLYNQIDLIQIVNRRLSDPRVGGAEISKIRDWPHCATLCALIFLISSFTHQKRGQWLINEGDFKAIETCFFPQR